MIRINLLPHREIKRKQQQKQFFLMLGFVVGLGATIWFIVHGYLASQLEEQSGRNAYLESEIVMLDKQIDEIKKLREQTAALLQRKKVVESLQANRAETVYLLDQMVRQLPDGVYLKGIAQKGDRVTVNGYAQSNARVSTFMRNLDSSPYLERPSLIEIKAFTEKNIRLSEFTLAVSLTRASPEDAAKKPQVKPVATGPGSVIPTAQVMTPTSTVAATPGTALSGNPAGVAAGGAGAAAGAAIANKENAVPPRAPATSVADSGSSNRPSGGIRR